MDDKTQNNTDCTNRKRKKSFWSDGLSIDETKMSSLIICLLAGMIYAGTAYLIKGDVSANLADIIIALIYSVASINVAGSLDNLITNRSQIRMKKMEFDHQLDMQEMNNSANNRSRSVNNYNDDYIDI